MLKKYLNITLIGLFTLILFLGGFADVSAESKTDLTPEQILEERLNSEIDVSIEEPIVVLSILYSEEFGIDTTIDDSGILLRGLPPTGMAPYFSDVAWIRQGTAVSLSLTPKKPYTIAKEASWESITNAFYGHPTWVIARASNPTSVKSMYHQYVCHADFAKGFKTPWNIEPYKPDKGYWGFANFGDRCN